MLTAQKHPIISTPATKDNHTLPFPVQSVLTPKNSTGVAQTVNLNKLVC
jgi:hypothetical protein